MIETSPTNWYGKIQWSYILAYVLQPTQICMTLFQGVSACSDCLKLVLTGWFSYSNLIPHLISVAFFHSFLFFFIFLFFFFSPVTFLELLSYFLEQHTISNTELVRISSNGYLSCGIIEVIFNKHVHFFRLFPELSFVLYWFKAKSLSKYQL